MSVSQKIWHKVEITTRIEAEEAIEFALNETGSLGTEINKFGKSSNEAVCVVGYFDKKPDDERLRFHVSHSLRIYGFDETVLNDIEWGEVENRDWLAEWKKHWKPTEIEKFIIAPPWSDVADSDKTVIRIEPNMAFGTGTHETTQLCLKTIGEVYRPSQTFLDVGTGTGILAIGAAKLSTENTETIEKVNEDLPVNPVAKIRACDTDADSVKIARENAIANDVGDRIDFFQGSIDDTTPVFDFVCANLTIDVIIPMLPLLLDKTGSVLLLSGILAEQETIIVDELKRLDISKFTSEIADEWISVIVSRSF